MYNMYVHIYIYILYEHEKRYIYIIPNIGRCGNFFLQL